MDHATIYTWINNAVMPAWLLLIILPKHKITKWVVYSYAYPLIMGAMYIYFIGITIVQPIEGNMFSFENVKMLFQDHNVLIGGWLHYLIFDLFIGSWIAQDAIRHNIHQLIMAPILLLTLFFGPVGLFVYVILRWVLTKKATRLD